MFPTDRLCGSGGERENKISVELRDFVLIFKNCHAFNERCYRLTGFMLKVF